MAEKPIVYVFDPGCVFTPKHVCVFIGVIIAIVFCKKADVPFGHLFFPVFCFAVYASPVFLGFHHFVRRSFNSILFCAVSWLDVLHLVYALFSHACVVFLSIVLTYAAGRCTLHATPVGRRRWAGLQLVKSFLNLRAFRSQLPSADVQALFGINVLILTPKAHMSGVYNRLLVDRRQ